MYKGILCTACLLLCCMVGCGNTSTDSLSSAAPVAASIASASSTLDKAAVFADPDLASAALNESDALTKLRSFSPEELGLPLPLDSYQIIFDPDPAIVEGIPCYVINAYSDLSNLAENGNVFFVALDGSVVYKLDSNTGYPVSIS